MPNTSTHKGFPLLVLSTSRLIVSISANTASIHIATTSYLRLTKHQSILVRLTKDRSPSTYCNFKCMLFWQMGMQMDPVMLSLMRRIIELSFNFKAKTRKTSQLNFPSRQCKEEILYWNSKEDSHNCKKRAFSLCCVYSSQNRGNLLDL